MTIIQPNKNQYIFNLPLLLLGAVLITMAVFSIYFYNQNVNLRHTISANQKLLQEQNVLNADYKNEFYQLWNSKNVELVAKKNGLIPEKNPGYLESDFDILASN